MKKYKLFKIIIIIIIFNLSYYNTNIFIINIFKDKNKFINKIIIIVKYKNQI